MGNARLRVPFEKRNLIWELVRSRTLIHLFGEGIGLRAYRLYFHHRTFEAVYHNFIAIADIAFKGLNF